MSKKIVIGPASFYVAPGNRGKYWDRVNAGEWEPGTFQFFEDVITPDTHVFDVGAWIGPTALFAVQLGASCTAFEPDPVAYAALEANVAENSEYSWHARLKICLLYTSPSPRDA